MGTRILSVAVIGTNVVSAGLRTLMSEVRDIHVVDTTSSEDRDARADVIVYDGLGLATDDISEFLRIMEDGIPLVVVAYPARPDLAARAMALGSVEAVSVDASVDEMAETVRRAETGVEDSHPVCRL